MPHSQYLRGRAQKVLQKLVAEKCPCGTSCPSKLVKDLDMVIPTTLMHKWRAP